MEHSLQHPQKGQAEPGVFRHVAGTLGDFFNKFNNDWTMQSAGTLAYNLMVAVLPIVIALIAGLGFIAGTLGYDARKGVMNGFNHIFPNGSANAILQPALSSLGKNSGWLGLIAVLLAIFGGSRLFIAIEGCFDITYRTRPRGIIAQNVMSILMTILFIILIPLMVFTSSIPALFSSLARNPVLSNVPFFAQLASNGLLISVVGVLVGLIICWILFEAILLFVPNQRISIKNSWLGALIAALLLEVFLALFPLYVAHFMGSYTGAIGFAVILLVFFYYFAVILMLGAQVNAYFAEHIPPLPNNLAAVLCETYGKPDATDAERNKPQATSVKPNEPINPYKPY